jgi:glycosyltransferase involved in cell wall biosynthesis
MTHCICIAKNEIYHIENFIKHHSKIFDKLTIVDNGSTDGTLDIIKKYDSVELIEDNRHFKHKISILKDVMLKSDADLIIPMDADEILIHDVEVGCIDSIKNELLNLEKTNNDIFRIKQIYNYDPILNNFYIHKKNLKNFFKRKSYVKSDPGYHNIKTIKNDKMISNLSYLHFHHLNEEQWFISSKQKIESRVGNDWNDLNKIKKYQKTMQYSNHIAKELYEYIANNKWFLKPEKFVTVENEKFLSFHPSNNMI